MKLLKNFKYLMLCVLSCGLMSCTPEKAPPVAEAFKVADEIQTQGLEGEIRSQIQQQESSQPLTHRIILTREGQEIAEDPSIRMQIKSSCIHNGETLNHQYASHLRPAIAFFEMVSPELLLQDPNANRIWNCKFEFHAVNSEGSQHLFSQENVPLTNSAEGLFSEIRKEGVLVSLPETPTGLVLKFSELSSYDVLSTVSGTTSMRLECGDFHLPYLRRNSDLVAMDELALDTLPASTELSGRPLRKCRVYIFEGERLAAVSPMISLLMDQVFEGAALSLINLAPTHYSWHWERRPESPVDLWSIQIQNPGLHSRSYLIQTDAFPLLKVAFVDLSGLKRSLWFNQAVTISIQLDSENGSLETLAPQHWRITLPAQSSASLKLTTAFAHNCSGSGNVSDAGAVLRDFPEIEIFNTIELSPGQWEVLDRLPVPQYSPLIVRNNLPESWVLPQQTAALENVDSLPKVEGCQFPRGIITTNSDETL